MPKRWDTLIAAIVIVVAGILVYSDSFSGPFIYDDVDSIQNNPRIHSLWTSLSPQPGESLVGRPVAQFSFAVNYALNDLGVRGYHTVNLVIHLLAGLALFGIARRTLLTPPMREKFGGHATILGAVIGLIWLVHPLQTESVTYLVQRDESLMGLFFFLTLYCAIRGSETNGKGWFVAAVTCCALGMATKERMAVAPLMVLLYDRTFLSGSFASALRRRTVLYVALALTWVVLIGLMTLSPTSSAIGFGCGVSEMDWLRHQVISVTHYLWLSFCPYPLILDYGHPAPPTFAQMFLPGVVLLALLAATGVALVRRPTWGFLGAWFFVTLAPTASFVPIGEFEVEHWMYVPLAGVVAVVVMGAYEAGSAILKATVAHERNRVTAGWAAGMLLAAGCVLLLGISAYDRNKDYRIAESVWQKVIDQRPMNERAYVNLGKVLADQRRYQEAEAPLRHAILLNPRNVQAYSNLGAALMSMGRLDEAITCLRSAINVDSHYSAAYGNLGTALMWQGHVKDAISCLQDAVRLNPQSALARFNLGDAYARDGQLAEAVACFRKAIDLDSTYAPAYNSLGVALASSGQFKEGISCFEDALRIEPGLLNAWFNLAEVNAGAGRFNEAIATARKGIEVAEASGQKAEAAELRERLRFYEAGKAWRDNPRP